MIIKLASIALMGVMATTTQAANATSPSTSPSAPQANAPAAPSATPAPAPAPAASEAASSNIDKDKVSYSIGYDLGRNIKKQNLDLSIVTMNKGLNDGYNGETSFLTADQMKQVLADFQKSILAKRISDLSQKGIENKANGDKFLQENKKAAGVVTLPSGLQYKIITAGTGDKPGADSSVTVDYTGRLISGEVFDSSEKSGKPATFMVSQVIPGWTEALQLMPMGSTWEIYVPAALAYGMHSVGTLIGPNQTLIFTIHLISINKASAAPANPAATPAASTSAETPPSPSKSS